MTDNNEIWLTNSDSLQIFQEEFKLNEDATLQEVIAVMNELKMFVNDSEVYEKFKKLKGITFLKESK